MKILFQRAFKMRTIIDRFGGETLRYFLMTTQYRNPLAYELIVDGEDPATAALRFPGLEDADKRCEYAYQTLERLREQLAVGKPGGEGAVAPEAERWLATLQEGLDDDFNTAEALAAWNEALQLTNRILDGKLAVPKDVRRRTASGSIVD